MKPDDTHMDNEFMDSLRLNPEDVRFRGKGKLKKDINDLTESQIEYLSVASLEKDLSPEQSEELRLNLEHNDHNRRIYDQIQKIRLIPSNNVYTHKNSLKKLTAGQRIIRITVTGLSAAATVAVLIVSYIILMGKEDKVSVDQLTAVNYSSIIIEKPEPIKVVPVKAAIFFPAETKTPSESVISENSFVVTESSSALAISAVKVPSASGIDFTPPEFSLLASNAVYSPSISDDDRGRVRKFIATTFRQKILGEKEFSDVPLKPYEIALAGIDGINRLLDWDMQLKETRDESGEVKSFSFSSALLSFNTPVKKSDE